MLLGAAWLFVPSLKAEAMTDIRVGLVAQYKDKDVLTVYNKRIMLGYATEKEFKAGEVFYGENGFSFEPDDSTYIRRHTKDKQSVHHFTMTHAFS